MSDNSILAVDFGNIHTRALLIDLVEGAFRLVARADERTTSGFPTNDVGIGMRRVISKLSAQTGRKLLTDDGRVITPEGNDRVGVDVFLTTTSVGRPLRTVVIGLFPEMSIASMIRATAGTYINVVDVISVEDRRTTEEHLNAIALADPDLIAIAGGTEEGATTPILEQARLTRLALRLMHRALPPSIIYAGNSALRPQIAAIFEGATQIFFADNVRPSLLRENIDDARAKLAIAFDSFTEQRGLGFDEVGFQARLGVLPNAQSYETIARYLGAATRKGVLLADVGSAVSTMSASVNGVVSTTIRTDMGLGHQADSALDAVGLDKVRAWLPFIASDEDIRAYMLNKTLRPGTIPQIHRTLYMEHALLRAVLSTLLKSARPLWTPEVALDDQREAMPPLGQIIGAGSGITGTGRPGMTAMLLLDALEPVGVTRLQADANALIPAMGVLARINPTAVVQVLDAGGLEDIGTAISLEGTPRPGRAVAVVTITTENGGAEKHTLEGGKIYLLPLSIGITAKVRVQVRGRGLTVGGRRGVRAEVVGGSAGVIIDTRGRPLPLEINLKARAAQIVGWYADATGDAPFEIPDAWLTPPEPVEANVETVLPRDAAQQDRIGSVVTESSKPPRRGMFGRGRSDQKGAPVPMQQNNEPEGELDDLRSLLP